MAPREARIESERGIVCERCIVADNFWRRFLGLMGRSGIGPDEGLLLVGSPSIHTSFMKFPIDVLFLDRKKKVLKIRREMKQWRMAACFRAHSVLELPAGIAQETGTVAGDQLELEKYE